MLGDQIGAFQGNSTVQRVLPAEEHAPKFDTTFEASGTILGINARIIGTYWSVLLPDGCFYGEIPLQSATITEDGDTGVFKGAGSGRFTGSGLPVSIRGAIYYQGARGKLAPLNGLVLVYEWEEDEHGNLQIALWEWK
jgi:hypothetical protein